jgi:hypothetical protein
VHAHGCLPPKLCGVAHLPRDGTGCEKDAARRSVRDGSLHAAEGEPGHQPSRDTPITTRTRAGIFAPEGFASRNLLGTRAILLSRLRDCVLRAGTGRTYDEVAATKTIINRTEETFGLKLKRLA